MKLKNRAFKIIVGSFSLYHSVPALNTLLVSPYMMYENIRYYGIGEIFFPPVYLTRFNPKLSLSTGTRYVLYITMRESNNSVQKFISKLTKTQMASFIFAAVKGDKRKCRVVTCRIKNMQTLFSLPSIACSVMGFI